MPGGPGFTSPSVVGSSLIGIYKKRIKFGTSRYSGITTAVVPSILATGLPEVASSGTA